MNPLNQFFDAIYVINLLRRPHKAVRVLSHLDQLNLRCNLFPAVDGNTLKISNPHTNRGAYGYWRSWYQIISEARERNYQRILCLDDDIWFHRNYLQIWRTFFDKCPTWVLCYLGASQHHQGIDWTQAQTDGYYEPQRTDGSFAVALSKVGIEAVWSEMKNNVFRIVDSGILRAVTRNYKGRCAVLYPNAVMADVSVSDIRESRDQIEISAKFRWNLSDYYYTVSAVADLISVIVPVYNAQQTIWASLMSLLNQSYNNLEIIIVDDSSTDHSAEIISHFVACVQERHDDITAIGLRRRVVYLPQRVNGGCYSARNTGLDAVSADSRLIAFQDADDVSLPHRLLSQAKVLWQTGALWVQCLILRTHLSGIDLNLPHQTLMNQIQEKRIHRGINGYKHCCAAVLGMVTGLYRRELFDKERFLAEPCGADAELIVRLLEKYSDRKNLGNVVTYLTNHRLIKYQNRTIFCKIDQVMYLCHQMTEQNLTIRYPVADRKTF